MIKIIILLIIISQSACSNLNKQNKTQMPPIVEVDGEKLVSVQSAFDLAFSSYIKACVEINHYHGKKKVYYDCVKQSRAYIEDLMKTFRFKTPVKSAN